MSNRDGFQFGVPCWVDTWQPDAEAAVAFYTPLFGWEADDSPVTEAGVRHVMLRLRDREVAAIGSRPRGEGPALDPAWGTYVWVENVDETVAAATAAGGSVVIPAFESLDGGRMAVLRDPGGAVFGVWRPGAHRGARVINEPNAWSMSLLLTDDPDTAKSFYAAVFGWKAEPFQMGESEGTLWRLPGYVGGVPTQPVPRDVVGVMAPAFGRPAAWVVNFWVPDADATAAAAVDLGGKIVAGPFDTSISREAVLADPAGAVFTVSTVPAAAA
jgi:predicted enzyme related to lactoylglutathione lyase